MKEMDLLKQDISFADIEDLRLNLMNEESSTKVSEMLSEKMIKGSNYFLSIIHDLKSPVSCLKTILDVLEKEVKEGQSKEDILDNIKDLQEVNSELNDIILNFLDVNLDDSYLVQNISLVNEVNVGDICHRVVKLNKSFSRLKDVVINLDCQDSLIFDSLDPRRLKQVLNNLLLHVINDSKPSSNIKFVAKKVGKKLHLILDYESLGLGSYELKAIFEKKIGFLLAQDEINPYFVGMVVVNNLIDAMNGKTKITLDPKKQNQIKLIF